MAGRAPPPGAPDAGLQVLRRADERRVRWRHQRGGRAQRLGQEQPRRRAALGARRAGAGPSLAQGRGRDLGRLGAPVRAGHGRRDPRPRQRRWPAAGRFPGARARSSAVPLGRERVPAQQAADPPARPRRPARRRASRRQRVPVHRPGHGRPGARAATRGTPARCSRRSPGCGATSAAAARPRNS